MHDRFSLVADGAGAAGHVGRRSGPLAGQNGYQRIAWVRSDGTQIEFFLQAPSDGGPSGHYVAPGRVETIDAQAYNVVSTENPVTLNLGDGTTKVFRMLTYYSKLAFLYQINRANVTMTLSYFNDLRSNNLEACLNAPDAWTASLCHVSTNTGREVYFHYGNVTDSAGDQAFRLIALSSVADDFYGNLNTQAANYVTYSYSSAQCPQTTATQCSVASLCCVGKGTGTVTYQYDPTSLSASVPPTRMPRLTLVKDSSGAILERQVWNSAGTQVVETESPQEHLWLSYNDSNCASTTAVPSASPIVDVYAPGATMIAGQAVTPDSNGVVQFQDGVVITGGQTNTATTHGTWIYNGSTQSLTCTTYDNAGFQVGGSGTCGCDTRAEGYNASPTQHVAAIELDGGSGVDGRPRAGARRLRRRIAAYGCGNVSR